MIGRFIDGLASHGFWEELDRLITAQRWCAGRLGDPSPEGPRCIRGWVENTYDSFGDEERRRWYRSAPDAPDRRRLRTLVLLSFPNGHWSDQNQRKATTVPTRYNRLVWKHGQNRITRLIKLRAGQHTRTDIIASEQPSIEPAATP